MLILLIKSAYEINTIIVFILQWSALTYSFTFCLRLHKLQLIELEFESENLSSLSISDRMTPLIWHMFFHLRAFACALSFARTHLHPSLPMTTRTHFEIEHHCLLSGGILLPSWYRTASLIMQCPCTWTLPFKPTITVLTPSCANWLPIWRA